jgi:recombination protein RecA
MAGFSDHERSFALTLAPKLGLDVTPGYFIFKKPRTFEESITIMAHTAEIVRKKKLIAPEAPICWVFDSLASMVPHSAMFDSKTGKERDAESRNMNDNTALARATSAHFPALAQHVEEFNICAIFLNQVRTKLGVLYGDPRTTPGGEAPKFYASQRLMLGASQIKKGTDIIGAEVTANIIKNKVSRPFLKASWRFVYQPDGTGRFDVERSTIEFMEREGFLDKGSRNGFVKWEGKEIGKEELARKLETNKNLHELTAMLPKAYEPPQIMDIDLSDVENAA